MRKFRTLAALIPCFLLQSLLLSQAGLPQQGAFEQLAGAVQRNCSQCHFRNSPQPNAIRFLEFDELITSEKRALESRAEWYKVYTQAVIQQTMPPPRSGHAMTEEDRTAIRTWIDLSFRNAEPRPMGRLTNPEYDRSIRDLFGIELDVAGRIQQDAVDEGFANNSTLAVSTLDRTFQYGEAARFVAETALGINGFLAFKSRPWAPSGILAENPNRGLKERVLVRLLNHKNRLRPPDPPNLHIVAIKDAQGGKSDALRIDRETRFVLHHEFPVSANYTFALSGVADAARSSATLRITIDGQPPSRIEFSGSAKAPDSYVLDLRVERGRRSIEVAMAPETLEGRVLLTAVEIAGPRTSDRPGGISCMEPESTEPGAARDCAARTIRDLAPRAFRIASVDAREIDALLKPFEDAARAGENFRAALSLSIQAVLMSPRFIYRIESSRSASGGIDDFEFATRLSYFLWGTMPDNELRALAARRALVDSPRAIRAQVTRMLADPRAGDGLVTAFAEGWLGYGSLRTHEVDRAVFPEFDEELRQAMLMETELYLNAFFRENWSIGNLIDSRTLFVNERLARLYGIANVKGPEFRRVEFGREERRGLLAQGSILTVTSSSNRTSVVKRGYWLLDKMLCEHIPEPPDDIPPLPSPIPGKPKTLRQAMAAHRAKGTTCAGCHERMDPLGFGLENYSGIGLWRPTDAGLAIDPSGTLLTESGPQAFRDFSGLRELLAGDERIPQCFTRKLMTYALGRRLSGTDLAAATEAAARTQDAGYRVQDVIAEIVLSAPFRGR